MCGDVIKRHVKGYLILILSFIIISSHLFITDFENKSILTVNASTTWTNNNNKSDFILGELNNVGLTSNGNLILKSNSSFYIEDTFVNNINISYSENLIFDNKVGVIRLNIINKTFGGKYIDSPSEIIKTNDGGYLIIGMKYVIGGRGTPEESKRAANEMAWLIKTDSTGKIEWNKMFGGNNVDWGSSVKKTTDGGYIIGGRTGSIGYGGYGDAWIIKTDNKGKEQWNKTYGQFYKDTANEIIQTSDNGYIFIGSTDNFGAGKSDIWLLKTDYQGNEQWNKTFGGSEDDFGSSFKNTKDGGFIITGKTWSYGNGDADIWLIKTNENGNMSWNKTFGGPNWDQSSKVIQTSDNGYAIVGATDNDLWLIKTDNNGNELWNVIYGNQYYDSGHSVIQLEDGNYIIVGLKEKGGVFKRNNWLLKLNKTGNILWERTYGGDNMDEGISIIQSNDNGFIIAGKTSSFSVGDHDIWLLRTNCSGNDKPVGKLVSNNILKNKIVSLINKFNYNCSLPNGTNIRIQFSQNNITWTNSKGTINDWDNLINGYNHLNLENLSLNDSNFYYKLSFYTKNNNYPELFDIGIQYSKYIENGTFISSPFSTYRETSWKTLNWDSHIPNGTEIKFQLRTSENQDYLSFKKFVGPNGNSATFYLNSGTSIWQGHEKDQWIQYKAFFSSKNREISPVLKNVSIIYNLLPQPLPIYPVNGEMINNSSPIFKWNFSDFDSYNQIAFQLLISDYISFKNIIYDTGEQSSSIFNWQFKEEIEDGIWYWKIRVKDNDGAWSFYSNPNKFYIDTKVPISELVSPLNNSFLNDFNFILGKSNDNINGSGLAKSEIIIINLNSKESWNGTSWNNLENWLTVTGNSTWHYIASDINWVSDSNYLIKSRAIDKANNIELPSFGITFMYDDIKPTPISIVINNASKYTNSGYLELTLAATDSGSGLSEMAFSTDNRNWTRWEKVNTTTIFYLSGSSFVGEKFVYFKVSDRAGNIGEPICDSIILDKIPPKASILINNNDKETTSTNVLLTLNGSDKTSGIDKMRFSTDDFIWHEWENFTNSKYFELSDGEGLKTIYFQVMDKAGNIGETVSDSINLTIDTDNDNIPDYKDNDDDNDNYLDKDEIKKGTDPLNPDDYPSDKKDEGLGIIMIGIIIIVIIIILFLLFLIMLKNKDKKEPIKDEQGFDEDVEEE
jgi:hypothetical protein